MSVPLEKSKRTQLKAKHNITPVSTYLKEVVYGGIDGIITTFAVVAGFTGAQSGETINYSIVTVLLFGLANLFADASSMGLGNFLSLKSEKDFYKGQKKVEENEITQDANSKEAETKKILITKGFTKEQAEQMTALYKSNHKYWAEFMMQYEVQLPNPEGENPFLTAFATFASFIAFGFIPLIPYLFISQAQTAFIYSCVFTLFAMALLGFVRWYVTKLSLVRSLAETILLGSISASVAYIVGIFFR